VSRDDDDTPELRPPSKRRPDTQWGDTRRTNIGADRRRADGTSSQSRRNSPLLTEPIERQLGAPEPELEDEVTSPHDMLERDLSQSEIAIIEQSRRNANDAATYADVVKLAETLTKARREERSNNKERSDQLMALLAKTPPGEEIEKRVTGQDKRLSDLEGSMKVFKAVIFLVVGTGGGSLGIIAERIWDRAEREGEAAIRLQHVESAVEQMRQDIRDQHRYSPAAERPSWLQPPTKEAKP
jgi:hypothetical protein